MAPTYAHVLRGWDRACDRVAFIERYVGVDAARSADEVVEVLHFKSQHLADIVTANERDADTFVGERISGVFQSDAMQRNALRGAVAMQKKTTGPSCNRRCWKPVIGIGINPGEVGFMLRQPRLSPLDHSRFVVAGRHA